nr:PEP/pyruvate-binding domain-containing protein [Solihabitans fulvus]
MRAQTTRYVMPFEELGKQDAAAAGAKGANLGELVNAGFPVPTGFVVTAQAYLTAMEHCDVRTEITDILTTVPPLVDQPAEVAAACGPGSGTRRTRSCAARRATTCSSTSTSAPAPHGCSPTTRPSGWLGWPRRSNSTTGLRTTWNGRSPRTALDRMPGLLMVYAVQAADLGLGVGLSPQVAAALPGLVDRVVAELTAPH